MLVDWIYCLCLYIYICIESLQVKIIMDPYSNLPMHLLESQVAMVVTAAAVKNEKNSNIMSRLCHAYE